MSDERPKLRPLKLFLDEPPRAEVPERFGFGESELDIGAEVWARTVARCILGVDGPFGIGIYGSWGKGKTSLLQRVMMLVATSTTNEVQEVGDTAQDIEVHHSCVYINAWAHERSDDPIIPLLHEIYAQLDGATETGRRAKQAVGCILTASLAAIEIAHLSHGEDPSPHIHEHLGHESHSRKSDDVKAPMNYKEWMASFYDSYLKNPRKEVQDALGNVAQSTGTREKIVVFIDDLDRCHPDNAVKILEALKLVLWHQHFVFVLALDDKIVTDYLTERYLKLYGFKEDDESDRASAKNIGQMYLDKIIQLPFPIPRYAKTSLERFYDDLVAQSHQVGPANTVLPLLRESLVRASHGIPRTLKRLMNQLLVDLAMFEEVEAELPEKQRILPERAARAFAINRILPDEIGKRLFRELSSDQKSCNAVLSQLRDEATSAGRFGSDPSAALHRWDPTSDIGFQIFEEVKRTKMLSLFEGDGVAWLTDEALRTRTLEFLVEQRGLDFDTVESQRQLVDRVIRSTLNVDSDTPITRERLDEITSLHLIGESLSDEGLVLLTQLTQLEDLLLSGTHVTDNGLSCLAEFKRLRSLGVTYSSIGDNALAKLSQLTQLERLFLSYTLVTDAGLVHLSALENLRGLSLAGCNISTLGVNSLTCLDNLHELDLSGTAVDNEAIPDLLELEELRTLDLSDSQVTTGGKKVLDGKLPNIELVR